MFMVCRVVPAYLDLQQGKYGVGWASAGQELKTQDTSYFDLKNRGR